MLITCSYDGSKFITSRIECDKEFVKPIHTYLLPFFFFYSTLYYYYTTITSTSQISDLINKYNNLNWKAPQLIINNNNEQ